VTSTATDGAFFIYFEDIDEQGVVNYVTEGALRALHRKIAADTPPYKLAVPYHSFKKKDAMPLVPGQIAELKFALQPTSVLIRKGHRLRIAIAGADKDTFARIPDAGVPVIKVARNKHNASWIELPVIRR
jgi:predicted acyl esterase